MRRHPLAILALTVLSGLITACGDDTTNIVQNVGLDCQLVRGNLTGTWVVDFALASTTYTNCGNASFNGDTVDVPGAPITFDNVDAFWSASSTSVIAIGADPTSGADPTIDNELFAFVEADSCLALVQVWQQDDQAWIQCVGTLDLTNRTIGLAVCDSADVDSDADGSPNFSCDLSASFTAAISTP